MCRVSVGAQGENGFVVVFCLEISAASFLGTAVSAQVVVPVVKTEVTTPTCIADKLCHFLRTSTTV